MTEELIMKELNKRILDAEKEKHHALTDSAGLSAAVSLTTLLSFKIWILGGENA